MEKKTETLIAHAPKTLAAFARKTAKKCRISISKYLTLLVESDRNREEKSKKEENEKSDELCFPRAELEKRLNEHGTIFETREDLLRHLVDIISHEIGS
ncbi:MAG: hypothetical protein LBI34_01185 [Puniceicoccales bacterium]|jgi:hypothetical protein|nr:hypothetical protein [Puniceicoccales bacterium]